MQKDNLTEGIKAVLIEGGAVFILLAISVCPNPFLLAGLTAAASAIVLAAVMLLGEKFLNTGFFLLSVAISGTVFGIISNLINYRTGDFVFIISALSFVYLISLLSGKFTRKVECGHSIGALAALSLSGLGISSITVNVNVSASGGMLITAAVIIFLRFLFIRLIR